MTTAELLRAIQHRTARVRDRQLEHARGGGEREEPPDGVLRAAEAHLDPAGLDRHACGQAGQARLERLAGHRGPDPDEPGLAELGDEPPTGPTSITASAHARPVSQTTVYDTY